VSINQNSVFIPAESGWYFTHAGVSPKDPPALHRVAVWRIVEDQVIGLIGLQDVGHLVTPPNVEGGYVHESAMSDEQRRVLTR